MPSSKLVITRMNRRIEELSIKIPKFTRVFERSGIFSGPSLYFHKRTIDTLRCLNTTSDAIKSTDFLELLYATLTSWGMHRMGPGNTKLRDFPEFTSSIRHNRSRISELENISLAEMTDIEFEQIKKKVWHIIMNLEISIAEARIVPNCKALHHILPKLIPPIDRTYTYNFFYGRNHLTISEMDAFFEMYERFRCIAKAQKIKIRQLVNCGWNTSEIKVLDNAIMGYVVSHRQRAI